MSVTLIRSSMLVKNHSAGRGDETPLITVHQRPPKKNAPSNRPAANAGARTKTSFIVILLFVPNLLVFLGHPVPRIQTTDGKPGHQQRQRPGVRARVMLVQPDTERCAEQRRDHHRPADQSHHSQTEPDALLAIAPRLKLACRLSADLLTKRGSRLRNFVLAFIGHGKGSPCGGGDRLPFSPTPSA